MEIVSYIALVAASLGAVKGTPFLAFLALVAAFCSSLFRLAIVVEWVSRLLFVVCKCRRVLRVKTEVALGSRDLSQDYVTVRYFPSFQCFLRPSSLSTLPQMAAPSLLALRVDNDDSTPSTFWGILGAPMAGNASLLAVSLHWLAIAFKWFLRLLLVLLAIGVVLGTGALIFGSLPLRNICRGGKPKTFADRDGPSDTEMVGLDFVAAEYDPQVDLVSDSGEEY